jgi:hypothetical protein
MSHRGARFAAGPASIALALLVLVACAPEPEAAAPTTTPSSSQSPTPIATRTPGATPAGQVVLPTDCRQILTEPVLAELEGVRLNDPAFGPGGVQPDGSLVCTWGDPAADTTHLTTTISAMSRGPALVLMNKLADEQQFTCYTPDGGTRCEATWQNKDYPVTDGRTVFWRDDILIDTTFSNLAPTGYTSAIVERVFG